MGVDVTFHILCVEDDEDVRFIVTASLQLDPDLAVVMASEWTEALDHLRSGLRPDLMLIDAQLADRDGVGLIEVARTQFHVTAPALILSAAARPADAKRYLAGGARALISKPFDPLTLAAQVRSFLAAP